MDFDMNINEFLKWEATTKDTIDFKKIYVDVANGDVLAGLVLSELVFWYLPTKEGASKLRCFHDGIMWIAARRYEWWDRCRITPNQSDRAIGILVEAGLVDKKVYKFNGEPTTHLRLLAEPFLDAIQKVVDKPKENPHKPKTISATAENEIGSNRVPVTETTTETTTTLPPLQEKDSKTPKLMESTKQSIVERGDMGFAIAANLSNEELAAMNERIRFAKEATDYFEREFAFSPLPWDKDAKWMRFKKFVVEEYKKDRGSFRYFTSKRKNEGQFTRLPSNTRIYSDPDLLIAIWPSLKTQPETTKGEHLL